MRLNFITERRKKIARMLESRPVRIFMIILIMLGLGAIVMQSFESMERYLYLFYSISVLSALIFTIEYILRIYCAPSEYPHLKPAKARQKYLTSFMGIIDLIAILPFTVPYFFHGKFVGDAIELGRIFLIFKILRYTTSFTMIREVIASVKYELLTAMTFALMIVSFCAILMYYIERDAQPDAFSNIGQGFWWAIITFTSVGYGDIYPITPIGKLLASGMALIGIVTLTLPTAILSGALMNRLQEQTRQRLLEKENKECYKKESDTNGSIKKEPR
ncbi:MAG: ion transporter [Bacteroidales bacterium]